MRVPEGWSVAVPYKRQPDGSYAVDHPARRFDRPTGWMAVGKLGIVRERVAGTSVAIAGPVGHGQRRLDQLALLRWTLPTLGEILQPLPDRLLVVGAGDPMWRGGLSGPRSAYLHSDRPLIAEDGTSPLLHELVHTALRTRSGPGGDALVEGLAELYSVELLARSRTVSRKRAERTFARLAERGSAIESVVTDGAGPVAGLVEGPGALCYGTTSLGGASDAGTGMSRNITPPADATGQQAARPEALYLPGLLGDILLARRDMGTSYHLSVVVDDATQGITHVTRGADLGPATLIHVLLQALLRLPTPVYHHHRLIRDDAGKRLAKRDDARAMATYRDAGLSPTDLRAMLSLPPAP